MEMKMKRLYNAVRRRITRMRVLAVALVLGVTSLAGLGVQPHANADPCFFTQGEFDAWMSEFGTGGFHDPTFAGWGDSLSRVQNNFAQCSGSWGQLVLPGHKCGITDTLQYRVWPKSNGDEVWIAFRQVNLTSWKARCHAGVMNADGTWQEYYTEP